MRNVGTILGCLLLFTISPAVSAPAPGGPRIEDGVYVLLEKGEGRKAKLADGSSVLVGKQLSSSIGVAETLRSYSNDNSQYYLTVKEIGDLPMEATTTPTALIVSGVILRMGRLNLNESRARVNLPITGEEARVLAARYKVTPTDRKHPGHRVEVRWVPLKAHYVVGEAVTLRMELKNTGKSSLAFVAGGKQRGPRDNQFRFVAQVGFDGKGLPDTGNAMNFGGLATQITLKPGEVHKGEVDVSKWFTFGESGTYRITGVYEMPMTDPTGKGAWETIWDELVVGQCEIQVRAKNK